LTSVLDAFVIKPSSYISGLCYSVFRVEPYSSCGFGCLYCYARWYRSGGGVEPQWRVVAAWRRLARAVARLPASFFFRLATLSEPFQGAERLYYASLDVLRTALRLRVPLVVNTKSLLVTMEPWVGVLEALAGMGLVVVQVSIGFPDKYSVVVEPGAPPASSRLRVVEELSRRGIPVVVRVQPLVPGLEEEQVGLAEEAVVRGAVGVIGESLRCTRSDLGLLRRLLPLDESVEWVDYQLGRAPGREGLLHPAREWRRWIHGELRGVVESYGAVYTACKEGVAPPPGVDCCQASIHLRVPVALRPTLYELARLGVDDPIEACRRLGAPYTCSIHHRGLFRRWLRMHEGMLRRLAGRSGAARRLLLL